MATSPNWVKASSTSSNPSKVACAIVGRSQQDVHFLGGAFVGLIARPLRQRLYIFYARVLIVYDYSSSGQAIFYKSIARVKGDVSVK